VWRLVRLGAQEIGENVPLIRREVVLVARGVEHRSALIERYRAQILKGALDHLLAIGREGDKLAASFADLRLLLRRKTLEHLAARQRALTLRLRHLVQPMQLIDQTLLRGRGKVVEAGIVVQEPLLILQGKPLVLVEPAA